MLTLHAPDLWTLDDPDQTFLGLRLGSRSTVLRLADGGLLVHSPVPLTDAIRRAVDALGPVRHLVSPNLFHHLHLTGWAAAYPEARVHAPAGLAKKRKDLKEHRLHGEGDPGWGDEVTAIPFAGFSSLDETVLLHRPSRTLITADLLENFVQVPPHWPTKLYLSVAGISGRPGMSRVLRAAFDDKKAAHASVQAILDHDFDRITVCHGQVLPEGGKDVFAASYAWLPAPR